MSRTALVLGAGMVGVSCALALQRRGLVVTLADRKPPGQETSFGNAGVISRSSILPLNNPSLWKSLPAYLGNRHLAIRYDLPHLLRNPGWILRFLAEARASRLSPRVAALDSLTAPALGLHRRLMAEAGIGHRLRETGWIKLWRGADGPAKAAADHAFFTGHGIRTEILDRQGISGLEPGLNPIFPAGLFHVDSASVDWPGAVVEAYAGLFAARGGRVVTAAVSSLASEAGGWRAETAAGPLRADLAVVALGPWSADLLRPLGLTIPLGAERGYHRHFAGPAGTLTRPIHDVDGAYMLTPMAEGFRLTCGVELSHRDAPDDQTQIDAVEPKAREAVTLGPRTTHAAWRGSRPTLPDSLPMIGQAPGRPGLWLAFGNQHIGFSTGPVTGEILAALVTDEAPIADATPFSPGRYL